MAVVLALLEGGSIFAAVCVVVLVWSRSPLASGTDVLPVFGQAFALSSCCVLAFYYNSLYDLRVVRRMSRYALRLPQSIGVTLLLLVVLNMLAPETKMAEGPFASSSLGILGVVLVLGVVLALRMAFYAVLWHPLFVKRVLIVGTSPLARELIEGIEAQPDFRYAIVGVADDPATSGWLPPRYPLLGPLERLNKIIDATRPDRIIVALGERRRRLPARRLLEARMRGIIVEDGVDVYERLTGKLAIESMKSSHLIFSKDFRKSRLELAVGRGISLLVSVLGLFGLGPVLGFIALAIKLDSRGPVFFVQERVGMGGRPFKLLKFRTMHPAKQKTSEWVRDNDDRITRVGKWLRKFRLDELPQFINILRGDMNLVGPRPHPVSNFDLFVLVLRNTPENGEQIPYYSLRCLVRPGMTGWAQVRYGYANNLEEEIEKMRYDLYYIKHLSWWFDLRILFETVKTVLSGHEVMMAEQPYRTGTPEYPAGERVRRSA